MDKTQEECNQLMLEAIRRKHTASNTDSESQSYIPTVFTIPPLRIPPSVANTTSTTSTPTGNAAATKPSESSNKQSPLNQFVLQQLQKNKQPNGLIGGFMVPQLKACGGPPPAGFKFDIPLLKRLEESKNVEAATYDKVPPMPLMNKLDKCMKKLSIEDGDVLSQTLKTHSSTSKPIDDDLIDLTKALIITNDKGAENARPPASKSASARTASNALDNDFKIPYIECDRTRRRSLPTQDDYCTLSVADVDYKHKLAPPSALALIFAKDDQFRSRKLFPCAATDTEVLHLKQYKSADYGSHIKRFYFDTKSPDDLVKESLNKYQRFSHT